MKAAVVGTSSSPNLVIILWHFEVDLENESLSSTSFPWPAINSLTVVSSMAGIIPFIQADSSGKIIILSARSGPKSE